MKKYETLKEVVDAIEAGEIDESKIQIVLDNDWTGIYLPIEGSEDSEELFHGDGYGDLQELYSTLFPKASVEHC